MTYPLLPNWREEVLHALHYLGESGDLSVGAGHAREHARTDQNPETTPRHSEQNTPSSCGSELVEETAGTIPTFVINLNRRTDRWQHFEQCSDTTHVNIERLGAARDPQTNAVETKCGLSLIIC